MQHRRSRLVVEFVTFAALVAACNRVTDEEDPKPMENVLSAPGPSGPLELVVEVPDQVAKGRSVPMKMILRNTGDTRVEVVVSRHSRGLGTAAADSLDLYNFYVLTPNGDFVRRRDDTKGIAALPTAPQTLRPNDTLQYEWTWGQRDQDGEPVASGKYQVIGTLEAGVVGSRVGGFVRSEPVSVTIR